MYTVAVSIDAFCGFTSVAGPDHGVHGPLGTPIGPGPYFSNLTSFMYI